MTETAQDHARLFVACEVPDEIKETIGVVIENLRAKSGTSVRWIRSEGVHVTLKFLGEVPTRKIPAVKLGIQEAVVGHSPFELEFSNIGTFGGREGLRIMWVGIAGDVLRLEALVRAVNAALAVVGFEPERRPFRPHLTLGRVRDEIPTRRRAKSRISIRSPAWNSAASSAFPTLAGRAARSRGVPCRNRLTRSSRYTPRSISRFARRIRSGSSGNRTPAVRISAPDPSAGKRFSNRSRTARMWDCNSIRRTWCGSSWTRFRRLEISPTRFTMCT